jgi:hypothetical protein
MKDIETITPSLASPGRFFAMRPSLPLSTRKLRLERGVA